MSKKRFDDEEFDETYGGKRKRVDDEKSERKRVRRNKREAD